MRPLAPGGTEEALGESPASHDDREHVADHDSTV
jgi:hypothetical protein